MKVLIYGINHSPELTGIGKYSGEMARWIATQQIETRVICAQPYYPEWAIHGHRKNRWETSHSDNLSIFRCPLYIPSKPSTASRVVHLVSFAFTSIFPLIKQLWWKPDVIILVVPTLICAPAALIFSKVSGCKSVLHIQDFEFDAVLGLGLLKQKYLGRLLTVWESFFLRRFDRVSTISESMLKKAHQKGVKEHNLLHFPNWADSEMFEEGHDDSSVFGKFGISRDKKVVLYSGNIGEKQGLENLVKAAYSLIDHPVFHFLVIGEGVAKQGLLGLTNEYGLTNITFAPLQPLEQLPTLLASASIHLVIQRREVASAVLPSKLTNILAAGGNAIITAEPDTSLGLICVNNPGVAFLVEPESVDALVSGIKTVMHEPKRNVVARAYARAHLEKHAILSRILSQLNELVHQRDSKNTS